MFNIEIVESEATEGDILLGRIIAGTLDEMFEVTLGDWSRADYEASWRREIARIVSGADYGVLMTVAIEPDKANWLRGYTLYRFGDEVRVQERIFFTKDLSRPFDLAQPGLHGSPYESVDEDGNRISEWVVPLGELQEYLDNKC